MPFGLKNAAQAFHRLMDWMLRHVSFAFVYLDDILIASADAESHKKNLHELFSLLQLNGIHINRKMCTFGQTQVQYLGHLVTADGIQPLPSRVQDLISFPSPDSKLGIQRFLGMINYYRRFIPNMASTLVPLHEAVKSAGPGKNKKIEWTEQCEQSFMKAKKCLSAAVLLHHPNPFSATSLTVDASEVAVGGELAQRGKDQGWQPLAFFLHALTPAERKYSAFDHELLAMYLAVQHFKHYLEGKPFVIFTDHKPLAQALTSSTDNCSPRQTGQLSYVAEFTNDVRHIKGQSNIVADALSRPSTVSVTSQVVSSVAFPEIPAVDFHALASAQDPGSLLDTSCLQSLTLRKVPFKGVDIWCDTAGGRIRPLVPSQFRRQIFRLVTWSESWRESTDH